MFRCQISWYLFAFSLLELIIKTHLTFHDSSHGFINKNNRYLEEDFKNMHEEISSGIMGSSLNDYKIHLKFEPSVLDFKQRPLGIPHMEKVTLFNIDKNKTFDMTSISGSTAYFHSSFFESKTIPPNGNTSFNVVFLGREEGKVEGNLFIHSTEGSLKYNVKASTTFSKYRLRPIVGVKLPVNATFTPVIYIHNPHSKPIQILEIYSSGGDFNLELPTGDQEGPNDMWEIKPYQTKAVIRVNFQAKVVQNHTAYVRIKLNNEKELLIVPLEVEVTPNGELVHPQGGLDFGIGGSLDLPKEVNLCLRNSMRRPVRIHSITSPSPAIEINHENVKVPNMEKANFCTNVATLTLDWKTAFELNEFYGKIYVKFRGGRNVSEINYYLTVLEGGISFDAQKTSYFTDEPSEDVNIRNFPVKNNFHNAVRILGFEVGDDAQHFFSIENFHPIVLKPKQEKIIFQIKLRKGSNLLTLNLNSKITLHTNISDIIIPMLSYKGILDLVLPFKSPDYSLDLGLIGVQSKKEVFFLLVNHNPVSLKFKTILSSIPMTSAELYGCGKENFQLALFRINYLNLSKCISLKPDYYAVIKLTVLTTNKEGQIWGDVLIETQYEQLSIPVHFKVSPGKLEIGPDRLVFDQCFPGKICSHPLRVHSTFKEPMLIEDVMSLPPDKRIYSRHSGHVVDGATKVVGTLYLNPNLECLNRCYTGLQYETTAQWLMTFNLKFVAEFDVNLVSTFYSRYLNETSNGMRKWQNLTIRIDTNEVKGHIFKTRVKMSWPSLLVSEKIENRTLIIFPPTQIGSISYKNITLSNPSAHNIIIQIILDKDYPNVDLLYESIPTSFIPLHGEQYMGYGFFFHETSGYFNYFQQLIDLDINRKSIPIFLQPGQMIDVTIGFKAEEANLNSALLFIRNNLTILEVLRLRGQGIYPQFKFGNRKPGSEEPLLFEITDRHIKGCQTPRKHNLEDHPNLTVRRSFTARNVGEFNMIVHGFLINDSPCEGYGFKVLNCVPFSLAPNATKRIDIAFTTDLNLIKVTRTLVLLSSLKYPVNYTLVATMPANYLNLCSQVIDRPDWEYSFGVLCKTIILVCWCMVGAIAYLDAERINEIADQERKAYVTQDLQPPLDLRAVGEVTRQELQKSNEITLKNNNENDEKDAEISKGEEEEERPREVEKHSYLIPCSGRKKSKLGKKISNELHESHKKKMEAQAKSVKAKWEDKKAEKKIAQAAALVAAGIIKEPFIKEPHTKDAFFKEHLVKEPLIKEHKDSPKEHKEPVKDTKEHVKEHKENVKEHKEHKKTSLTKKVSNAKIISVPPFEFEESTSTSTESTSTTDSSFNVLDDTEFVEPRSKSCSKSAHKVTHDYDKVSKQHLTMQNINHVINHNFKAEKQKSIPKKEKTDKSKEKVEKINKRNHGKAKTAKDRKEKMILSKTNSNASDKSAKTVPKATISPPILAKAVWGENAAKFSDVVARSDNLSTNRPLCQVNSMPSGILKPIAVVSNIDGVTDTSNGSNYLGSTQQIPKKNKPTVYVEPYKKKSADLGPVGSRRMEFLNDVYNRANNANNSYFSSSNDLRIDPNPNFPPMEENSWAQHNSFGTSDSQTSFSNHLDAMFSDHIQPLSTTLDDSWGHLLNTNLATPSYWNENYPLVQPEPAREPAHPAAPQNNYLWGSSSVWQPWAPVEEPKTPTRTPPGFNDLIDRNNRDEDYVQVTRPQTTIPQRDSYSPFTSSNIWNQDQASPWTYSQGH